MRRRAIDNVSILLAVVLALTASSCGKENPSKPAPSASSTPAAPERVTTYESGHPDVSPDGTRIAMELGPAAIAIAATDGSQLDTLDISGMGPDWSPDGARIAVAGGGGLVVIDIATKLPSVLGTGDIDGDPDWSPDGSKIAAHTTMGGDGIGITTYPGGAWSILPCVEQNGNTCDGEGPTWAPDGSAIAFEDGLEILRVASGGGTASVVVEGLEDVTRPAWSPDGKWIAVEVESVDVSTLPPTYFSHVWVADARGMRFGLRQITRGPHSDRTPSWSRDSRAIYFESDRGGAITIWKVAFQP